MGMDVVEETYRVTQTFPEHETYGPVSQMRRATVSIPSNIAEGYTRQHRKEYLNHLSIAQASLAEMDTQVEIAACLDYLLAEQTAQLREHATSLSKQLYSRRRSLSPARSGGQACFPTRAYSGSPDPKP